MSHYLRPFERIVIVPGEVRQGYQPHDETFDITKIVPPTTPTAAWRPNTSVKPSADEENERESRSA